MRATHAATAKAEQAEKPVVFTKAHAMFQATGQKPEDWLKLTDASRKAYATMAEAYEKLSKG